MILQGTFGNLTSAIQIHLSPPNIKPISAAAQNLALKTLCMYIILQRKRAASWSYRILNIKKYWSVFLGGAIVHTAAKLSFY